MVKCSINFIKEVNNQEPIETSKEPIETSEEHIETIKNIFGINDVDYNILEAYDLFKINIDDREKFNKWNKNFHLLKRYNLENFIYDPIYLFFVLKNLRDGITENIKKENNFEQNDDIKKCYRIFVPESCDEDFDKLKIADINDKSKHELFQKLIDNVDV